MSEEVHKPVSPHASQGKGWDEVVSDAQKLARKPEDDEPTPPKRRLGRGLLLGFLTVVLLGVAAWDIYYLTFEPSPTPDYEELSLRASVYLAVRTVEGYQEETGALPRSLQEVGMDDEGLEYTLEGDGFSLVAPGEANTIRFRSEDDLAPYEAAFPSLLEWEGKP
jgi:hypothetical protein